MPLLQLALALLALPCLLFLPGYLLLSILWHGRPKAPRHARSTEPPVATPAGSDIDARIIEQRRRESAAKWMGLPLSDVLFQGVLVSTLLVSALAFLLAEVGLFSFPLLLALVAGLLVLLAVIIWRQRIPLALPWPAWTDLFPLLLVMLSVAMASRPYEYILGSGDAGSYVNIGVSIADTGGIILYNDDIATLDPQVARQEMLFPDMPMPLMEPRYHHFPSFLISDLERGQITPQFYHLFPTWIAIGYSLLGLLGSLYVTPMFGVLAIQAVYFAGKKVLGQWAGLLGSLFLSLNMVQMWFSRYPTSEIITQYFVFSTIYLLALWLEAHPACSTTRWTAGWGVLAGGALAALLSVRVDSWLALLPLAGWALYLLLFRREDLRVRWSFFLALGLVFVHFLVYFFHISSRYTLGSLLGLYYYLLRPGVVLAIIGLGVGGFGAVAFLASRGWLKRHERFMRGFAIALFAALAVWAYFIWPAVASPQTVIYPTWPEPTPLTFENDESLVRLGWYMTPWALLLGTLGLLEAIRREPAYRIAYLLAVFLLYGVVYTFHVGDSPMHIHVMRRYVPEVIPTLALGAGYAVQRLGQVLRGRIGVAVASLLAGGLLVLTAMPTVPFLGYVEYAGATGQVSALAARFGEKDILLYDDPEYGALLGMPLQYIYHRTGFVLQQKHPDVDSLTRQLRAWEAQGRPVYLIVTRGRSRLRAGDFTLIPQGTLSFSLPRLEQVADRRPSQVLEMPFPLEIYQVRPAGADTTASARHIDIGTSDYPYVGDGLLDKEVWPDGPTFRWTSGRAELLLPGDWFSTTMPPSILLCMGHNRPPDVAPPEMEVWLDHHLLGQLTVQFGFHTYTLTVPLDLARTLAGESTVHLYLDSDVWKPSSSGLPDERELGVFLDWVEVR